MSFRTTTCACSFGTSSALASVRQTVAVRYGDFKIDRQRLKTKQPGAWEVYDLSRDRAESKDLAGTRADLIQQAEELLRREVGVNTVFPLAIPGVTTAVR